jgi:precorrin-2/cobalt-factor-2 C20-methyltransferase
MSGTLFGIGVGPGDPELLTLKAARRLATAAVVAYPAPLVGESLARSIVAAHLRPGIEEIALRMPFVAGHRPDDAYDAGAAAIAGHLAAGRDVAVLCEGDPLLFGSFIYLLARLGHGFPVEIVPGVSSVTACAAVAAHPLTIRDDALVIVPATRPEAEIEALLAVAEAAAIMKVGRHLEKVRRVLQRLGLANAALCIERAGQPGQRIRRLDEVEAGELPYFAIILLHKRGKAWTVPAPPRPSSP